MLMCLASELLALMEPEFSVYTKLHPILRKIKPVQTITTFLYVPF
jgi:hypothetical protein